MNTLKINDNQSFRLPFIYNYFLIFMWTTGSTESAYDESSEA